MYKPLEPTKYNSMADVAIFHKFMQECEWYLCRYDIEPSEYAEAIFSFMTEKADKFYTIEVSWNLRNWELREFFVALFNYCFSVNF